MVYKTLEIVLGFWVTESELEEILSEYMEEEEKEAHSQQNEILDIYPELFNEMLADNYNKICFQDMKIYHRGHQDDFLIGYPLHKYYRFNVRCNECKDKGRWGICDSCIGQTNNGYYNVYEITTKHLEVPVENICHNCYNDNKKKFKCCELCNRNIVEENFCENIGYPCYYDNLEVILSKLKKGIKEIKLYYVLDDCLCCS